MLELESPLHIGVLTYILLTIALYIMKPNFCFYNDEPKSFGILSEYKCIYPFYLVSLIISIFVYFFYSLLYC